jgi:hypothetical protein
MHDGRSQRDVAHALAAHAAVRDFHAALGANNPLVLRALVPAAAALVVLLGAEDALTEQAVRFGPVGAVVDGLWLLDFAEAPAADIGRTRQGERDRAVVVHEVETGHAHRVQISYLSEHLGTRVDGSAGFVGCRIVD